MPNETKIERESFSLAELCQIAGVEKAWMIEKIKANDLYYDAADPGTVPEIFTFGRLYEVYNFLDRSIAEAKVCELPPVWLDRATDIIGARSSAANADDLRDEYDSVIQNCLKEGKIRGLGD